MVLAWLIFYMLIIISSFLTAPLLLIWFLIVEPFAIFSLLSLVPLILGILLLLFWIVVNGYFVSLGVNAVRKI